MLEPGTWQSDIDVGEQFYNYLLHPSIRPYCGIDVDPYLRSSPEETRLPWLQWQRCVMGLASSPHGCVKMQMLAEELVRGDHLSPSNPFYFDQVRLNLPGSPMYNPSLPRVSKIDSRSGRIAADMSTYVDDIWNTGPTALLCWQTSHRISTHLCYLGIQDALRKRTIPSLMAGAWTGSIAQTSNGRMIVTCTEEKWKRARDYVLEIQATVRGDLPFNHKVLEQQRGFLVYLARTFPSLVPYLKGIHLTLDSWRPGRDSEGWKSSDQVLFHLEGDAESCAVASKPPEWVRAVPRLASDVEGLLLLLASPTPPVRTIRASSLITVYYGFGDASGAGFGDTLLTPKGVTYRCGIWGDDLQAQSSNYRELFNLTEAMEAHAATFQFHHLQNLVTTLENMAGNDAWLSAEIFMFTDNAVAEAAFYKGSSSNKKLFELVLRLRKLEVNFSLRLHLIHVSGKRMQAQGTDHLSRGIMHTGVLGGVRMLDFIPLHLSAVDRSSTVVEWCTSWLPDHFSLALLGPQDWFFSGHGLSPGCANPDGVWQPVGPLKSSTVSLWAPAPGAADAAVEQLAFSRHKRPGLAHIFVCPRLMTHLWRKRLFKTADITFALPAGFRPAVWPDVMFEPLIVGVCLPYSASPPWSCRSTPAVLEVVGELSGLRQDPERDERLVLRKLWGNSGGAF